jgi:hypothetical protein
VDTLASDAERDLVCSWLRDACVQGRLSMEEMTERVEAALLARTRAELEALVRDLPPSPQAPEAFGLRHPPPGRWHLGVVGSTKRSGRWRVPAESWWTSLVGGCHLDLTRAVFEAPITTLNIATWMGGIDIRVPRGFEVRVEGIALMGGKHLRLFGPPPPPGGPVIRIRVLSCMGRVRITDRESIRTRLRSQ